MPGHAIYFHSVRNSTTPSEPVTRAQYAQVPTNPLGPRSRMQGNIPNNFPANLIFRIFGPMPAHAINFQTNATFSSMRQTSKTVLRHLAAEESTWAATWKWSIRVQSFPSARPLYHNYVETSPRSLQGFSRVSYACGAHHALLGWF